ncbi:MAG: thiamine phosphate synthase [Deltaproteobacteria bacterium]|nr:thiamine phosphate synthase [Deltaproteobacteria bacterium]
MKPKVKGLYTIIDPSHAFPLSPREVALQYLQGGATILQLRMKSAPAGNVFEVAREIMGLKELFDFQLIINDHLEVAREIRGN